TTVDKGTIKDLSATSMPYAVSRCGWAEKCPSNTPATLAFAQVLNDGTYYALKANMRIANFNLSSKQYHDEVSIGAHCMANSSCGSAWWDGRWSSEEALEVEVIGTYHSGMGWADLLSEPTDLMGCMQRTPLRYGDINQDEKAELVILLTNGYS